jgi:hypothetical protein
VADTAHLVKTNSYGFFGYVVPGVVVTLYLITIVSYLTYGLPFHILAVFHQAVQTNPPGPNSSGLYEYISFLLVFMVAAYIVGHLSEAGAQMIYDRFYMRRIYGHRLRQLILDEGTDRKETHKNFYRAAISSLYLLAFIYLLAVAIHGRGFGDRSVRNAGRERIENQVRPDPGIGSEPPSDVVCGGDPEGPVSLHREISFAGGHDVQYQRCVSAVHPVERVRLPGRGTGPPLRRHRYSDVADQHVHVVALLLRSRQRLRENADLRVCDRHYPEEGR